MWKRPPYSLQVVPLLCSILCSVIFTHFQRSDDQPACRSTWAQIHRSQGWSWRTQCNNIKMFMRRISRAWEHFKFIDLLFGQLTRSRSRRQRRQLNPRSFLAGEDDIVVPCGCRLPSSEREVPVMLPTPPTYVYYAG